MPIIRHNRPTQQRLGNNIIYGEGQDATVVITTTVVITQDMYYQNLTINSGGTLFTNGFRVFVAGNLVVSSGGVIGMPAAIPSTVSVGTVFGRGADGSSPKTYVIGDSAAGTQVPADILNDLENIIQGWNWSVVDGFKRMEGADDGADGADTPGSPGGGGGAGGAGTAGNAGNAGGAAPAGANPTDPLGNPGTAGNPGNPGTDGNPGSSGNPGATGPGGEGGIGGGLVLVVAKNISGTGSIVSQGGTGAAGTTGGAGNPGAGGSGGAGGNPGTGGAAGNPSPTIPGSSHGGHGGNVIPGDPPADADAPNHAKDQSDPNPYHAHASHADAKPHSNADTPTNPSQQDPGDPNASDSGTKQVPGDPVPCEIPGPGFHYPPNHYTPGPPTMGFCSGPPEPWAYGDPADPYVNANPQSDPIGGTDDGDPVPLGGGNQDPQPLPAHNQTNAGHSQNPPLGNPKTGDPVSDPPAPSTNPYTPGGSNAPYTNPGGTAGGVGTGGAAGAAGGAGTAGTGGTGVAGTDGGLGGIIIITDSVSPLSTTQVSATYSHLQLST